MRKCYYDTELEYHDNFCDEMQDSAIRTWCKKCPLFTKKKRKEKKK
jgi:hypothetical protein